MDALDEGVIVVGIEHDDAIAVWIDRPFQRAGQRHIDQVAGVLGEVAADPARRAGRWRRRGRLDDGTASHDACIRRKRARRRRGLCLNRGMTAQKKNNRQSGMMQFHQDFLREQG